MANLQINRTRFFDSLRAAWGPLRQGQVDGIERLLSFIESDSRLTDLRQIAYVLATVMHETARRWQPIEEIGRGRGHAYGKKDPVTNQFYYGRGYVQITWRQNYKQLGDLLGRDLVNDPGLALDPRIAYDILVEGMTRGIFTGRKLRDYITGSRCDYLQARRIVNSLDQAERIAGYARNLEDMLRLASTP